MFEYQFRPCNELYILYFILAKLLIPIAIANESIWLIPVKSYLTFMYMYVLYTHIYIYIYT